MTFNGSELIREPVAFSVESLPPFDFGPSPDFYRSADLEDRPEEKEMEAGAKYKG